MSFVVFILALGITGSFGFQHSDVEGPLFVVVVIVGLASPPVAFVYLVWQAIAAVVDMLRPRSVETPGLPAVVAMPNVPQVEPPQADSVAPRRMSLVTGMDQSTALVLLIFVLVAGVYMWRASDPASRTSADWTPLLRDSAIGFVITWILKPYYDARAGRETIPRERFIAAFSAAGLLAMFDALFPVIAGLLG